MTDPVFLGELPDPLPEVGATVILDGAEGRHAATVRRIRTGELLTIADGAGRGVVGPVLETGKDRVSVRVAERLSMPEPALRITVVQALAKGDRSEIACEMITELGGSRIVPWQASRSVVRWSAERATKGRARWQRTVRESTKQCRRLRIPSVDEPVGTDRLVQLIGEHDLTLALHEQATGWLSEVSLPERGSIMIIIGPEGGIAPEELDRFTGAGARAVLISDGVLRTSTAAAAAISGILLR